MEDQAPVGTLTVEPASRYLGVSVITMRRWVRDGVIAHARYCGRLHFRIEDLDAFVTEHMVEVA